MGSLNPSSALKFFISSLPRLFPNPQSCWELLLSLLPQTSSEIPSLPVNPLFDEDPVNDYAEELVLMQYVVEGVRVQLLELRESESFSLQHYSSLASHLPALVRKSSSGVCAWRDGSTALNSRKMQLLSPLVALVSKETGGCDTLVKLTKDTHITT